MKAFEAWKNDNCKAKNCPHEASCNGCENMWKEALRWVLRRVEYANSDGSIIQDIKDELLNK